MKAQRRNTSPCQGMPFYSAAWPQDLGYKNFDFFLWCSAFVKKSLTCSQLQLRRGLLENSANGREQAESAAAQALQRFTEQIYTDPRWSIRNLRWPHSWSSEARSSKLRYQRVWLYFFLFCSILFSWSLSQVMNQLAQLKTLTKLTFFENII